MDEPITANEDVPEIYLQVDSLLTFHTLTERRPAAAPMNLIP